MSLNEKYTQEELDAIPPFTGFHHNKTVEEIMEKASQAIKDRCNNLHGLVFKSPKDKKKSTEPSLFLLDEIAHFNTSCYDAPQKGLTYEDEVGPFGKRLSDFSRGIYKDNDIHKIPENDYKLAENISVQEMLIDRIKKENKPREVIEKIVDKVYERKANNKHCEVTIMSISDYDSIQSMHDFKVEQIEVMGYKLKIHSSLNLEDGNIEIY